MKKYVCLMIFILLGACSFNKRFQEDVVKTIYVEQFPQKEMILAYEVDYDLVNKNDLLVGEIENFCGISSYKVISDNILPNRNVFFAKISDISSMQDYYNSILLKSNESPEDRQVSIPIRVVAVKCNYLNTPSQIKDYIPLLEREYLEKRVSQKNSALQRAREKTAIY